MTKPPITWTDDLNVGIDDIDKQHRGIVQYINQLHDACQTQNREAVALVIEQLIGYTQSHFSFEEAMMEKARYDFLPVHKRIHNLFERRIRSYQDRFAKGEDVAAELLDTLVKWLANHIKLEDKNYVFAVRESTGQGT